MVFRTCATAIVFPIHSTSRALVRNVRRVVGDDVTRKFSRALSPLFDTLRPPVRRHTRAIDDRRRRRRATPVPLGSVCEKWRENYVKRDLFSRASLMAARPACPSLRLVFPVETESAPIYTHIYICGAFFKKIQNLQFLFARPIFFAERKTSIPQD